ncbi:uncharacterized protein LOC127711784 isoform X2 [Mytilus californianus]|uniref:uncharacterized protein LOC127711784 isoform X2 n=1 Tax=Mytilus californianus TaxID=6549 RepID=UPI0022471D66|nr:uncharacterized protein LOC127711784 isoform X2 [Mytilus californianus]
MSWNGRTKFRTVEATTTDATGHYDEIKPYDEISEEQLEQLERIREPYYSTPLDVVKLKRTHSLPYIKPNRIRDAHIVSIPEIRYPNGSPKMHKYLSLPNLCNKDIMKAPYIELNMLKEVRHYNKLKQHSHDPTGSSYLHPCNSLLRPGIIGSGYLHPYTALKKKTEHTGTSFNSNTCVERPVSGENKSNTSVNRSISEENKSISFVYRPVSGENKSNTSVYRPISEENKSISCIYRLGSADNTSNTSVTRPISDENKSIPSIYRPVSADNKSNTSVNRPISEENTVNSEIIAMFLLLRKMRQDNNRNNLNSHFEIFYMN